MINQNTDFFQTVDNFSKIKDISSIAIVESKLNFSPQVTIAIPTYKRSDLLKVTLDSALEQKGYDKFEVLIVDNDPERNCETEKLIAEYSDTRVSYYKNAENLGMINNWNRCIELAKSKWVIILHDDDLLLPNFVIECMNIVDRDPDIGALKPNQYQWHDNGEGLMLPNFEGTKKVRRVYELDHLMSSLIVPPTGILFNKEKVGLVGGFNADLYPNSDLCFITLFSYFFKVCQTDQVLSVYRWLSNASLQISTLQSFIINDYYLYSYIFKRFNFPKKIASMGLNIRFGRVEKAYQKANKDFKFDIRTLGMEPVNKTTRRIYHYLLRLVIMLFKIAYKVFEGPIFGKRRSYLVTRAPYRS